MAGKINIYLSMNDDIYKVILVCEGYGKTLAVQTIDFYACVIATIKEEI
jgi:hypothetical protein